MAAGGAPVPRTCWGQAQAVGHLCLGGYICCSILHSHTHEAFGRYFYYFTLNVPDISKVLHPKKVFPSPSACSSTDYIGRTRSV